MGIDGADLFAQRSVEGDVRSAPPAGTNVLAVVVDSGRHSSLIRYGIGQAQA
jgi:hypothetical protein